MRVTLFGNSTWCLFNFREGLIRELVNNGYEVSAIAPLDPTYENSTYIAKLESLGAKFYPLTLRPRNKNPIGEIFSILQLFFLLRKLSPDWVLSYTVKCNLYAGLCRQLLGFKQIANIPGLGEVFSQKNLVMRIVFVLYKVAFRGITAAFFQNRVDLNYCARYKMIPVETCRLIPGSGVNLRKFQTKFPPRSSERKVFLMFGRLLPQKGYLLFIEAAKKLRAEHGKKVECWIMGIEDKNRVESTELLKNIIAADNEGIIRRIPATTDVSPILSDVDTVVLPSRYNEGIPRSLLEALASGKIIITSDWKGCRETVEHGVNGLLVDTNEDGSLELAMRSIIDTPETELRRMGMASRRMAEAKFDEQLVIDGYLKEIGGRSVDEKSIPVHAMSYERQTANS